MSSCCQFRLLPEEVGWAQELMDHDYAYLKRLDPADPPALRFYNWRKGAVTFGYFTNPVDLLSDQGLRFAGLNLGRRCTGGGLIFHDFDLAFAIWIPSGHEGYSINTLLNYSYVNNLVARSIHEVFPHCNDLQFYAVKDAVSIKPTFCMAKPTVWDITFRGKKVAGAAQRRLKNGYLHHGSICLTAPEQSWLDPLVVNSIYSDAIYKTAHPLVEGDISVQDVKNQMKKSLINILNAIS